MTLRPVREDDRQLIENLFNLYRSDISPYCEGFDHLDSDGFFDYGVADEILPFGDGVFGYIILENAHPVGFIMVTDERYALDGCIWRFQELFLIRPARGRGLATQAALKLMQDKPGAWCLSVYKKNAPARRFWENLINEHATPLWTAPGEDDMLDIAFQVK